MKSQSAAAPATLHELLAKAKDAKGDDFLEALSAVINKLVEERKAGLPSPAPGASQQNHQH